MKPTRRHRVRLFGAPGTVYVQPGRGAGGDLVLHATTPAKLLQLLRDAAQKLRLEDLVLPPEGEDTTSAERMPSAAPTPSPNPSPVLEATAFPQPPGGRA